MPDELNEDADAGTYQLQWNVNPFETPVAANQFYVVEGPGSRFGPDGSIYVYFGHVSPPFTNAQELPAGQQVLPVTQSGAYVLTLERAQELAYALNLVISRNSALNRRGPGVSPGEFDDQ